MFDKKFLLFAMLAFGVIVVACAPAPTPTPTAAPATAAPQAPVAGVPLPVTKSGYPSKTITILAPANPGGGWDQTSRLMQQVLTNEKIVPVAAGQNVRGIACIRRRVDAINVAAKHDGVDIIGTIDGEGTQRREPAAPAAHDNLAVAVVEILGDSPHHMQGPQLV